ncbi:MAG TPA: tetratricopeptide repeat protein [Allosphingosinicella sp.]|nr:tetratricopeptide repeat protein [Allosphingosinicella sp.]
MVLSVSRLALGLALGAGAVFSAVPAGAHSGGTVQAAPNFTEAEYRALAAVETALSARNYAAAASALSSAQGAVRGADARYFLATLQLRHARETGNVAAQAAAIDTLVASGRIGGADLAPLYAAQGATSATAGKREQAEAALTRALALTPNADTAISLARIKLDLRKNAEAVTLIQQAIDLRRAAGQPVPQGWYRRGASVATMSNLGPQAIRFARELVAAYPTPVNWRDALLTYRDYAKPDQAGQLDTMRLLRLSKGLAGERDYLEASQTFDTAGLSGESRSVLDEGVSTRTIDPAKASFKEAIATSVRKAAAEKSKLSALQASAMAATTGAPALQAGDMFLGAANYPAAIDLFQAAVRKGGVDPNVASTRLGIALALAGRKAEAEAAFRAVAAPRADLAALWLVWLSQRA